MNASFCLGNWWTGAEQEKNIHIRCAFDNWINVYFCFGFALFEIGMVERGRRCGRRQLVPRTIYIGDGSNGMVVLHLERARFVLPSPAARKAVVVAIKVAVDEGGRHGRLCGRLRVRVAEPCRQHAVRAVHL